MVQLAVTFPVTVNELVAVAARASGTAPSARTESRRRARQFGSGKRCLGLSSAFLQATAFFTAELRYSFTSFWSFAGSPDGLFPSAVQLPPAGKTPASPGMPACS